MQRGESADNHLSGLDALPTAPENLLMSIGVFRTAALVMLLVGPASAQSRSLADVARQEEARRKAVTPGKVYTNDTLKKEAPAAPAQPSAPADKQAAGTPAPPPPAAVPKANEPKKDEAYYQQRLQAERDAVSRDQIFADSLQTRINALSADFVNRDDPAQRDVIAADRDKALAELERVTQEIEQHTKAIADLQEEGRKAGAPAGWLR